MNKRDIEHDAEDYLEGEWEKMPDSDLLMAGVLDEPEAHREASRAEYAALRMWLDRLHPGWEAQCGLAPVVYPDGHVEWLPGGEEESGGGKK